MFESVYHFMLTQNKINKKKQYDRGGYHAYS